MQTKSKSEAESSKGSFDLLDFQPEKTSLKIDSNLRSKDWGSIRRKQTARWLYLSRMKKSRTAD